MDRTAFLARSETFGFDTDRPWALPAIRLVCSVPRAYAPLVETWDRRHPGTRAALEKMVDQGFVAYQPPVVVDTRTGKTTDTSTRRVPRYRTTWKGHELVLAAREDIRVLEERFPRTSPQNMAALLEFLSAFDLDDSHAKFGLSTRAANTRGDLTPPAGALTGPAAEQRVDSSRWLPERTAKWWVTRLVRDKYLRRLETTYADVREVVPEHWRVTRALSKQLTDVLDAFSDDADALKIELRLKRARYLDDIDPRRVGVSGATDFDHDVECQRILATLFRSEAAVPNALFGVEPRIVLAADDTVVPARFGAGKDPIFYQPDAEMRERTSSGGVRRSVIEYERYQSRRDAWSHIERFLGYLHARTLPFEPAVLRFVVDSKRRERTYVELIEAFADYAIDHPDAIPSNPVTLAVSSVPRVNEAPDPLADAAWFRVLLPTPNRSGGDTGYGGFGSGEDEASLQPTAPCVPVLHPPHDSPYNDYFARTDTSSSDQEAR